MKKGLNSIVIAGIMALAVTAGRTSANTVGFSPDGGGFSTDIGSVGNDGFYFTPTSNIFVTQLGYFQDGLTHQSQVGIYQVSTDALMISTSVNVTPTINNIPPSSAIFSYTDVSATELFAGTQYAVVGLEPSNLAGEYVTGIDHMNPAAGITFNGYFYDYNNVLDLPTNPYNAAYFGPNFQFSTTSNPSPNAASSVPLPASAMSGLAMLGLMLAARMRRRKVAAAAIDC